MADDEFKKAIIMELQAIVCRIEGLTRCLEDFGKTYAAAQGISWVDEGGDY